MSVYIRGMKMPKNHNHVTITIWSDGTASYGLYNRGESLVDFRNVEAVPVPEHGRLINADELKTAFPCGESVRTECVRATIDHAPTIVPADEVV